MNKTICVTFPRSGHHFLMRNLFMYFNDELKYCEYYSHCKNVPCTDIETVIQKNHDFNLKLSYNIPNFQYIVQYRDPLGCLVSFFDGEVRNNRCKMRNRDWKAFALNKIKYWEFFMNKWVVPENSFLKISYDSFIQDRKKHLYKVIQYIFPHLDIDESKLDQILIDYPLKQHNRIDVFKFQDKSFFKKVEDSVHDTIIKSGLQRKYA